MCPNESPSRVRLETVFSGGVADRTPILGGWIACPEHICALAGASPEEYWADPTTISLRAYEILGTDGLIDLFVPKLTDDYRCVDHVSYAHSSGKMTLDELVAKVEAMPSPETIEDSFDFDASYAAFAADLREWQQRCGDMVWMRAQWSAGARAAWYQEFGYEEYFTLLAMYEDCARKLIEVGGAQGVCRSRLIAQAVRDGLYPHAVLLGEDLCSQRGPMISTDFLEKYYAPTLRRGLEPLLDAGCRPVWHCDGDVRPMLDMLIDCGVQGLQGFQPECGMNIEYVAGRRTREGQKLVIFGPLAVTTELPVCSPGEIRRKVRDAIAICRDNANLVLFTGNTINPDVPLANILAMYEAVKG